MTDARDVAPAAGPLAVGGPSGGAAPLSNASPPPSAGVVPILTSVGFEHDREPPAEWTALLRTVSPVSDVHGHLELVWEPGEPWHPWQRWTLYEMLPLHLTDDEILAELRGPHPRSEGHLCLDHPPPGMPRCYCRRKYGGWKGSPALLVTLTQWKLYRRTGRFGNPWWVMQGTTGGHKVEFTSEEKEFLSLAGLPTETPAPGDLPYAPFDQRVVRWITRYNRLAQCANDLRAFKRSRSPEEWARHKEEAQRQLREQFVALLTEQMQEATELFVRADRDVEDSRAADVDWEKLDEESTHHYVETGELLHPSTARRS